MWSAIKSDLSEFVSTVKEDTSSVLNKMDETFVKRDVLSPEEEEALRRMNLPETYTSELDTNDEEVEAFLNSFSLEDKVDDMKTVLETHADTVKVRLEELVPETVTHDDFWKRYYFRCDAERIAMEWEEDKGPNPMNALGNLIGGTLSALKRQDEQTEDGATKNSLFQGVRPPFVMNTAVSEDDDDEEEELGWDDDDEEEEEDEEGEEEEEQIVFKDEVAENLKSELKQALEERDALQQTVLMQAKELAAMKESGAPTPSDVEDLRTQLFEKESELSAMKAKLVDDPVNQASDQASDEMKSQLEAAKSQISHLSSALESKQKGLEESLSRCANLEARLEEMTASAGSQSDLDAKYSSTVKDLDEMKIQKASLEKKLEIKESDFSAKQLEMEEKLNAAKADLAQIAEKHEEERARAESATSTATTLEGEIESLKAKLKEKEDKNAKLAQGKLASTKTNQSTSQDDDDDDDWGDDWGEDD